MVYNITIHSVILYFVLSLSPSLSLSLPLPPPSLSLSLSLSHTHTHTQWNVASCYLIFKTSSSDWSYSEPTIHQISKCAHNLCFVLDSTVICCFDDHYLVTTTHQSANFVLNLHCTGGSYYLEASA